MKTIKPLLQQLQNHEKLSSVILERLQFEGYIKCHDISDIQTPPGCKDWLFIAFTENGRHLLADHASIEGLADE